MKIYPESHSEAGQESFVISTLNEKREGYYVEIGAYHSVKTSNTHLLETGYGWKGVAFEILPECAEEYNLNRSNPCICADATTFDYLSYFEANNFPTSIDYLQLDIEPAENTLKALKQLPLDKYRFKTITFEHDLYASPDNLAIKLEQQEILKGYGYKLYKDDVVIGHNPEYPGYPADRAFEDWWIDLS